VVQLGPGLGAECAVSVFQERVLLFPRPFSFPGVVQLISGMLTVLWEDLRVPDFHVGERAGNPPGPVLLSSLQTHSPKLCWNSRAVALISAKCNLELAY
jgi:hypothetical protein